MFKYEQLLVLPVPFRQSGDGLLVELQARHGLERWLDHFETLVLVAPVIPEPIAVEMRETHWVALGCLSSRVRFVGLPWAYRPDQFIRYLPSTISILNQVIDESRYLQFALGAFWGDWAAMGAEIAMRKQRKFAIHTDRVEHESILRTTRNLGMRKRWRAYVDSFLMKAWHKRIIKKCHLGLFHGMDTYQTYIPWMPPFGRGFVIHNIHDEGLSENIPPTITPAEMESKASLRIFYAGRLAPEKAPEDWVNALGKLYDLGVGFQAIWAGDGPLRESFMLQIDEANITELVDASGFISERKKIAAMYQQADIFVFTHVTPESPRCLLEALKFGVPIVGYDSAFARDLISRHGGGVLVPLNDWQALTQVILKLAEDRPRLKLLKHQAAQDGKRFTSRVVFSERAELIKKHI